ncbi:MAG: NF038122 family metalloprotease [Xenococcus sp. MO_188.B8]|nr:NF038122 family metalloprotease [Xenococcus sp. MO_188.B8]
MDDFSAVDFNFSFAPGVLDEQIVAFEMAGEIWSHYLKDNVAVNIHVEMTDQLPENVIGGALPGMKKDVKYDKLWKEMSEDRTSSDDLTAFNNRISTKKNFTALVDGRELKKVEKMKLTNANAKALDFIKGDDDKLDGYILMSDLTGQSNVQWDYNPLRNDNIAANSLDFLSVALHEIGHVLGFVSGVDDGGWLNVVTESNGKTIKGSDMKFATSLDLFRYSSKDRIDFSVGQNPYFSIDGGNTNLGYFSTGEYSDLGGDGYQASHWKHNGDNPLGIMDPVLKMGQTRNISTLDTTAMDVIGWDVVNPGHLDWQQLYDNAIENAKDALIAERTKDVEKMVEASDTYHGRRGSRGSSSGSWQVGLWQHIKFQTLDVEVAIDNLNFQSESDLAQIVFDRYFSEFDSNLITQNKPSYESGENKVDNKLDVEKIVVQLVDNSKIVASKNATSTTLDVEVLGDLLSGKLEDMLKLDVELLVMPIK